MSFKFLGDFIKGSLKKKKKKFWQMSKLEGGVERVHVKIKNHSHKTIFKQFYAVLETFIFSG